MRHKSKDAKAQYDCQSSNAGCLYSRCMQCEILVLVKCALTFLAFWQDGRERLHCFSEGTETALTFVLPAAPWDCSISMPPGQYLWFSQFARYSLCRRGAATFEDHHGATPRLAETLQCKDIFRQISTAAFTGGLGVGCTHPHRASSSVLRDASQSPPKGQDRLIAAHLPHSTIVHTGALH